MGGYTMRIAICDDEMEALQTIAGMTKEIAAQDGVHCEVVTYHSGKALLEAIHGGEEYSLLLLDVMMDEIGGMDLAAALRELGKDTAVVFISSNRDMALRGYEVAAVRYLAKPVEKEKLREALLYCWRSGMARQELALPTAKGTRKFSIADVIYAETWGRGVRLTLTDGQEEVSMKISELEAMLPGRQFVMCHRAYLVNLDYVQYIRYCELELKTGGVLPVSKYRQNDTREKLMNYLAG